MALIALRQQDFAFALVIGLADHAVFFYPLDQSGRAIVSDLQAPLDIGSGYFAFPRNDLNGFVQQIVRRLAARHVEIVVAVDPALPVGRSA